MTLQIRNLLAQHGVHLNEAANGIYLPQFTSVADEFSGLGPVHSKLHTTTYRENVWNRLSGIQNPNGQAVREELQRIALEIAEGQFPH